MSPAPTCMVACCATSAGATASGGSTGPSTSIRRCSTIDGESALTPGSRRSAVALMAAPLVVAALEAPAPQPLLYVSNELANTITVISPSSAAAIATIAVGRRPRGMALSPAHRTVYAAPGGDDALGAIEVSTGTTRGTLRG